jgi:hypothetical protein
MIYKIAIIYDYLCEFQDEFAKGQPEIHYKPKSGVLLFNFDSEKPKDMKARIDNSDGLRRRLEPSNIVFNCIAHEDYIEIAFSFRI